MRWDKNVTSLSVVCVLALAACGGSSAGDGPTATTGFEFPTTSTQPGVDQTTVTTAAGGSLAGLVGDLPKPCEFISAEEMSVVLGVEVDSEESFGSDCFYTPVEGFGAGFDAHTSVLDVSQEECEFLLQTDPVLPGESVEPAPEYGDLASIITTNTSTDIQICSSKASINVHVSGNEDDLADDRLADAKMIVDMILDDLDNL